MSTFLALLRSPHLSRQALLRGLWRSGALLMLACATTLPAQADEPLELVQAAAMDRPRLVQALLAKGVSPNIRNERGQTPLILALLESSNAAAEVLLAAPELEVNARNNSGETALMAAALRGNLPAVRTLLARGAQVNHPGWTPLHYAASGESGAITKLLIEQGAQLEARAPTGVTPLMMAARYGSEEVFNALCEAGADSSALTPAGQSVMDAARAAGRDFLVERLQRAPCTGRVR